MNHRFAKEDWVLLGGMVDNLLENAEELEFSDGLVAYLGLLMHKIMIEIDAHEAEELLSEALEMATTEGTRTLQ